MQGEEFHADTLAMPLAEYDLILGVQWLKPLSPLLWDFQQEFLQFTWKGKTIKLDMAPKPQLKWVDERKMLNVLQKNEESPKSKFFLVQLRSLEDNHELHNSSLTQGNQEELTELLQEFSEVFKEPSTLPLQRGHDHHIPLKPGVEPVHVRPYK